jgi:hypothetical protein
MPATGTPAAAVDATPAPTGEAGAPGAATSDAPAADVTPAAAPPAAEADKPGKHGRATSQQKPADKPAREHDERLPPVGTVLRRVDRPGNVRCECTIEEGGIRYNGTLYLQVALRRRYRRDQGHGPQEQDDEWLVFLGPYQAGAPHARHPRVS